MTSNAFGGGSTSNTSGTATAGGGGGGGISGLGSMFQTSANSIQAGAHSNTALGYQAMQSQAVLGNQQAAIPYSLPMARNALADHCALAVYERRMSLKAAAKEMPGDYDLNRKLLGDVFLMSPCHMTLEQAASLAFALREEVGSFLEICDHAGAIIPSGG